MNLMATATRTRCPRRSCVLSLTPLLCLLSLGSLLPNEAEARLPQVRLRQERTAAGQDLRVKVYLYSKAPVGAYTLELAFDPAELEVVGFERGAAEEFSMAPVANRSDFDSGRVRFSAFQYSRLDGPQHRVHVATIKLRPRPSDSTEKRRRSARLQVRTIMFADTEGRRYRLPDRTRRLRVLIP